MTRRLFTLASLLSLAMCLASVVLWVRSDETADWVTYQMASPPGQPYRHYRASLLSVGRWLIIRLESVRGADPADAENEEWLRNLHADVWSGLRLTHMDASWAYVDTDRGVIDEAVGTQPATVIRAAVVPVPFAAVVVLCLSPRAALAYRRIRRRNRRLRGRCIWCGYDLRATSGRCPECGAIAAEAKP